MASIHNLGILTVQYIPEINRYLVKHRNGKVYYTNDFSVIRKDVIERKESVGKQMALNLEVSS